MPFMITFMFLKMSALPHNAIPLSLKVKECFASPPFIVRSLSRFRPPEVASARSSMVSPFLAAVMASSKVAYSVSPIFATPLAMGAVALSPSGEVDVFFEAASSLVAD